VTEKHTAWLRQQLLDQRKRIHYLEQIVLELQAELNLKEALLRERS
jgi:hypothetical protein